MIFNRRMLAAILVFSALGYLVAYTIFTHPYFTSTERAVGSGASERAGAMPSVAEALADAGPGTSGTVHNDQPAPPASVGTLAEPTAQSELSAHTANEMQSTISALSDPEHLRGSMASSLMAERDFDDLIRGLEKSSAEAYERQALLLDVINRLDPVLDNSLRPRVLNCNEVFCGASFNYDSDDVVLDFMGALLATGAEPGAMAIQPVVIDDTPQLRVIIHRSASYQVD